MDICKTVYLINLFPQVANLCLADSWRQRVSVTVVTGLLYPPCLLKTTLTCWPRQPYSSSRSKVLIKPHLSLVIRIQTSSLLPFFLSHLQLQISFQSPALHNFRVENKSGTKTVLNGARTSSFHLSFVSLISFVWNSALTTVFCFLPSKSSGMKNVKDHQISKFLSINHWKGHKNIVA